MTAVALVVGFGYVQIHFFVLGVHRMRHVDQVFVSPVGYRLGIHGLGVQRVDVGIQF